MTRAVLPGLLGLLFLALPAVARADDAKQFNAKSFTLANGL